jgi:minor extracellular serine protease Vpr
MCWLVAAGVLAIGAGAGAAADGDLVRVVVQLDDPALAKYRDTLPGLNGVLDARTPKGHLDVKAPASRAYLAYLAKQQRDFEGTLKSAVPSAGIQWHYDTAFNGMTIEVPRDRIDAITRLPHVVSVSETYKLEPELDESRTLLGLQTLWQSLPSSPLGTGVGLRLALIDSGTNAQHPFFNDSGFAAPAGYPKSQRVSGGVRTNLPLATYTNNKVIVANVYPYPGNTTATPWGPGSQHATHVAGIMAGRNGTYNYTSGPATFSLQFSDEADTLNVSLGHSRWLTTDPEHDPIRDALDGAVGSGTIVAVSSGNAGANGDSSITGSFKMSPKIITVANSSHGRVFSNAVSVTGPGTVPANLMTRPGIPAAAPAPPIAATVSGEYVVAPGGTGGAAGLACAPFAAGSLTGKIALVSRGTCTFDQKKQNVMAGGAAAMIVHNNSADAPIAMGAFTLPAIPSVMVTLADGRALVSWAASNPGATVEIAAPLARLTSGWPDVVAASSSRGPAVGMGIKPDIAAPGSSILSSSVNDQTGAVNPAALFDQLTGTSMSTPHSTALAALTKLKHPTWTPAQVKSALMNTAQTQMSLDLEGNVPALAKHRGAGRVNAARLVNPLLTFDPPSISFGLVHSTETKRLTITATDMRDSGGSTGYSLNVRQVVGNAAVNVVPTPTSSRQQRRAAQRSTST